MSAAERTDIGGLVQRVATLERDTADIQQRLRVVESHEPDDKETGRKVRDHEERIRTLEKLSWKALGVIAGVTVLGSALGGWLVRALGGG